MRALRFVFPLCAALALFAIVFAGDPPPAKKPWGPKEKKAFAALLQKYVAAEAKDRPAIMTEIKALEIAGDQIAKQLPTVFSVIMQNGKKSEGKGDNHTVLPERLFTDDQWKKDHKGHYLINGDSKAKQGKPLPLFIALHGGGKNSADAGGAAGQWAGASSKCIVVAPWVLEPLTEGEWNKDNEQEWLHLLIDEIKYTYLIDTNRIYVAGHSMGGYGSWGMGGHHPGLFAAVGPCASAPIVRYENGRVLYHEPGCLENFYNTWLRFYNCPDDTQVPVHGSRYADAKFKEWDYKIDGKPSWDYHEYQGIGHGYPPDSLGPIIDWMLARTRNAYPKKLIWMPTRQYRPYSYWLSVEEVPGNAGERCRIEAEIKDNVVDVNFTKFTPKVTVWLCEQLVDFKKPVIIRINGTEKFNGMMAPSFEVAVESAVQRNDSNMIFTAKAMLFDLPPVDPNGGTTSTGK
ncbi:MAG: Alpha/beta hydrolase [Planctomycetota bacterium]|nr:MAG: Alpha/beta hydrolase [Planctomycetota bacterium]